jgi:uncharacterized phiE125 gp8 family phage protein
MGLNWVQATTGVVTLAELKDELRIDHTDEDTWLDNCRLAATQWVERNTNRVFVQRAGFVLTLPRFPYWGNKGIALYPNPVVQIDSIQYVDGAGTLQAYGGTSRFYGGEEHQPAWVLPELDTDWPDTRGDNLPNEVRISFTGGFGLAVTDTPEALRKCALWASTLWYEQRLPLGGVQAPRFEVPMHLRAVMDQYRVYGGESGGAW